MDTIGLRGQAEFCLRLLQLWTDRSLAGRLSDLGCPLPRSCAACRVRRSCRSGRSA